MENVPVTRGKKCPCPQRGVIDDVDIRVSNRLIELEESRRPKMEAFINGVAVGLTFAFIVLFFFPLLEEK